MRAHIIYRHLQRYHLKKPRFILTNLAAAFLLAATPLLSYLPSYAIADGQAPVLDNVVQTGLTTIDITDASLEYGTEYPVTYDVTWHDDLSGYSNSSVAILTSPTGQQYQQSPVYAPLTGDGSVTHVQFNIPMHSETGVWTMTIVLKDLTGNTATYTAQDLQTAGYTTNLTLTGTGDTQKPTLVSASLVTPSEIDTSVNPGNTTVEASITAQDNNTGWDGTRSFITWTAPSGNLSVTNQLSLLDQPGGIVAVSVPQYAEGGIWTPLISMADAVGNTQVYSNTELLGMGIDLRFTVIGTTDTAGPEVHTLNIGLAQPIIEDVPLGGGQITFIGSFTDNLSGLGSATRAVFTSPSGNQQATAYFNHDQPSIGLSMGTIDLPAFGESGNWKPTVVTVDNAGTSRTYTEAQLNAIGIDVDFNVTKRVATHLLPGQTLSSDEENDGTTATDQVEASVTSPVEGDASISIIQSDNIEDQTNSYTLFGHQISIHAPQATAADPLTIGFRIDSTLIPSGVDPQLLTITRNGTALTPCLSQTEAIPDACLLSVQVLGDGDVVLTTRSSHASVWGAGFPTQSYSFNGFKNPIKAAPLLNKAKAGEDVKIKFDLGGNQGLNILDGAPQVQSINCNTQAVNPNSTSVSAITGEKGLRYKNNGIYEYSWDTRSSWENSCRQLIFKFTNGSVQKLFFSFKD